jgi:predicted  nucleic acid-binding Zn-ribbon protein
MDGCLSPNLCDKISGLIDENKRLRDLITKLSDRVDSLETDLASLEASATVSAGSTKA